MATGSPSLAISTERDNFMYSRGELIGLVRVVCPITVSREMGTDWPRVSLVPTHIARGAENFFINISKKGMRSLLGRQNKGQRLWAVSEVKDSIVSILSSASQTM